MSASEFSPLLQEQIVNRLRKRLKKTDLAFLSSLETSNIRSATNAKASGYEAVFSRGNLETLAKQFSNTTTFTDAVLKSKGGLSSVSKVATSLEDLADLATQAASLLSSNTLFDNFVEYLSKISGTNRPGFIRSNSGNLAYTQLSNSIKYGVESTEKPTTRDIIISSETHGTLIPTFTEFLNKSEYSGVQVSERLVYFIREQLNAGHLVGVFNIRFKKLFNLGISKDQDVHLNSLADIARTKTSNIELTEFLNTANALFIQADFLSSNAITDPEIFLTAEKRVYSKNPSVTVELQLALGNQEIGRKLVGISKSLDSLIGSVRGFENSVRARIDKVGTKLALSKLANGLKDLSAVVKKQAELVKVTYKDNARLQNELKSIIATQETLTKLIQVKGSDSILESIENAYVLSVLGKKVPIAQVTKVNLVDSIKKKVVPKKSITTLKTTNKNSGSRVSIKKIATVPSVTANLVKLQDLLNQRLFEQIKQNMGTGSSTNILNYRSGRFANSVKVERMSQGREGMITAFYSYMKYPYATFSEGGAQQFPKTRDPKLLISKSIREIAQTLVTNKLRAVNV